VGFDDADHDVFAAAFAADTFAQHAEGFADAGSVAEEDFEASVFAFSGLGFIEPVFRSFSGWWRCGHREVESRGELKTNY